MQEPGKTFKFVTVWLLMLTAVFLGMVAFQRWDRQPRLQLQTGGVLLERGSDGHYHWAGRVNGRVVIFLIDTGASRTTLPGSLARELALPLGEAVQAETAAGKVVAHLSQAELELEGGPAANRWDVMVVDTLQGAPLLGMDVLSRLNLSQRKGRLSITWP